MAQRYVNIITSDQQTHFEQAVTQLPERSRMVARPVRTTTFNAGRLVPIYCREVLPSQTLKINVDFVVREVTMKAPVLGSLQCDIYAFFVPNRIVYTRWKEVMGENVSGAWAQNSQVSLPNLLPYGAPISSSSKFSSGSIADHYGLPTQQVFPNALLAQMNDLRFRGYFEIYNEYFRDQNYMPPIQYSKTGSAASSWYNTTSRSSIFQQPLIVRKFHDYFTSVLPEPQKGEAAKISVSASGSAPVYATTVSLPSDQVPEGMQRSPLVFDHAISGVAPLVLSQDTLASGNSQYTAGVINELSPINLWANVNVTGAEIDVSDIRLQSAVQRLYEQLGRVGSRYREYLAGFFGIEVDNPMRDVPTYLGHIKRDLETYQTAQTSSSTDTSPLATLGAFSYTRDGGELFQNGSFTAVEHGYIHIFAVVRQRNIYSSYVARDFFRLSMLDFYQPQLANIGEQPVYTREINPFVSDPNNAVFGYQEAWAEYRDEPDTVSGLMRKGLDVSLSAWSYADNLDPDLAVADDDFIMSNAEEVVNETIAVESDPLFGSDQFLGQFVFTVDKELPMPVYSVPELE